MKTIRIYSPKGSLLIDTPIFSGSKRKMTLMEEDCITVKFSSAEPLFFPIGSYCFGADFGDDVWRYDVTDIQNHPTYNRNTGGYDYEVRMDAYYMKWKNKIFKFNTYNNGGSEASWSLTAGLATHLDKFIGNLDALGYAYGTVDPMPFAYEIRDVEKHAEARLLTYDSTSLIDALSQMAEAWECEWWVEGRLIVFGHCECGEAVDFEIGANCESIVPTASKQKYGTRLYAFGSTRNIPSNYRSILKFEITDKSGDTFHDRNRPLSPEFLRDKATETETETTAFNFNGAHYVTMNRTPNGYNTPIAFGETQEEQLQTWDVDVAFQAHDGFLCRLSTGDGADIDNLVLEMKLRVTSDTKQTEYTVATAKKAWAGNGTSLAFHETDFERRVSRVHVPSTDRVCAFMTLTAQCTRIPEAQTIFEVEPCSSSAGIYLSYSRVYISGHVMCRFYRNGNPLMENAWIDCTYNPNKAQDGENRIQIPWEYAARVQVGDRYIIDEDGLRIHNIPASYYTSRYAADEALPAICEHRLMLPIGYPYIDSEPHLTPDEVVEVVKVFDDIYPKRTGTISSLQTKRYTDKVESDGGQTTYIDWNAYVFQDTGLDFNKEWQIDDTTLQVQFQTGSLAGMVFDVIFHGNGFTDSDNNKHEGLWWEIVRNEDYGRPLPDAILRPYDGSDGKRDADTYILLGFDVSALGGMGYIDAAEQELLEAAQKHVEQTKTDPNTYTCQMFSGYAYGMNAQGEPNPALAKSFPLGQRVRLVNDAFFGKSSPSDSHAYRLSRVIGWEKSLERPWETPSYTVGESAAYSRLGKIEGDIQTLTLKGLQSAMGGGTGGTYLIKRNDPTPPTEYNAYSAARAQQEFLSGTREGIAEETIRFRKGLTFGSGQYGIDGQGTATLAEAILDTLRSRICETGPLGRGWKMWVDDNGVSHLEVDEIFARLRAVFTEIEVRELTYAGGDHIFSAAGNKILSVREVYDGGTLTGWKCLLNNRDGDGNVVSENHWRVDDFARCQTFNFDPSSATGNRFYWRRVTEVGDDYIVITAATDAASCQQGVAHDTPQAGDAIAQLGNATDGNRQGAVMIRVEGKPRINVFSGISGFTLPSPVQIGIDDTGNAYVKLGEEDGAAYLSYNQRDGLKIRGALEAVTLNGADSDTVDKLIGSAGKEYTIWFGDYTPSEDTAPTVEWTTDAVRQSHLYDLFYDTRRGVSEGARAWRYEAVGREAEDLGGGQSMARAQAALPPTDPAQGGGTPTQMQYMWCEVTDQDTIDALEKAAEADRQAKETAQTLTSWADDNVISPTEHTAVIAERDRVGAEMAEMAHTADVYFGDEKENHVEWNAYRSAGTYYHNMLCSLVQMFIGDRLVDIPGDFRTARDTYYTSLAALRNCMTSHIKTTISTADGNITLLTQRLADTENDMSELSAGFVTISNDSAALGVRMDGAEDRLDAAEARIEASVEIDENGVPRGRVKFTGDTLEIDTDNFKLDRDGNVKARGDVECSMLSFTQKTASGVPDELSGGLANPLLDKGSFYVIDNSVEGFVLPALPNGVNREITVIMDHTLAHTPAEGYEIDSLRHQRTCSGEDGTVFFLSRYNSSYRYTTEIEIYPVACKFLGCNQTPPDAASKGPTVWVYVPFIN